MKLNATAEKASTRDRILGTAFNEFYRHGFQGGSINRIVSDAGITKGALFHHFSGKNELGYQVVEEIIRPTVEENWINPLLDTDDPIRVLRQILYSMSEKANDNICQGCPLNNLAQEMSPRDEGFRARITAIYHDHRRAIKDALARGIKAGNVRKNVVPERAAAFVGGPFAIPALAGPVPGGR